MTWTIGVDVGGTFTDFYAVNDESGVVRVGKRPSTPANPAEAILLGLEELASTHGIDVASVSRLGHGTTVGTNALIQRRGANIAVVTTKGFGDLLEIGRQTRPHMFDMFLDYPPPLADEAHRIEIDERVTADGTVLTALTDSAIDEVIGKLKTMNVDSVAVCCLFAFIHPEHERKIGQAIASALPDLEVSLSSDVQPEFREFERFSTTAINAFLQPIMAKYIAHLEQGIASRAPDANLGINQSSGGLMSPARARSLPVRTALSGPAAGAVGAVHVAAQSGMRDVITLDMGGTSADVALIQGAEFDLAFDRDVAGFPIRLPMVDIETVGAGGGSIAWFDRDGLMKVGPASAGADPGPACYGRGGTEPTVSDANLALGRLSGEGLLGGDMALDADLSKGALEPLGSSMGLTVHRTAHGIVSVVVANMVRAIRTISVEKGHDPRRFALMPFGGAGPLHARDVAEALGISTIIVPLAPGIVCAQGLVVADLKEDFVRSLRTRIDDDGLPTVLAQFAELTAEAQAWFAREDAPESDRRLQFRLDMRYVGQNFELAVPIDNPAALDVDYLRKAFFAVHERSYGYFTADDPVEMVNARLTASTTLGDQGGGEKLSAGGTPESAGDRDVWFGPEKSVSAVQWLRDSLVPGQRIDGPAVIDQLDTTTLIYPEDSAVVDAFGNIVITLGGAEG